MKSLSLKSNYKIKQRYLRKFINSYLTPRTWELPIYYGYKNKILFGRIFEKIIISLSLNNKKIISKVIARLLAIFSKLFIFPDMHSVKIWITESYADGQKSPTYFRELDDRSKEYISIIKKYVCLQDTILDLGCNCGRHINELVEIGYTNFAGVDVSKYALEKMQSNFPKAYDKSTLFHSTFQSFLVKAKDKQYDVTISFGATLELVSPTFNVVRHISRITKNYVIININEHGHAYPRFWEMEFRRYGFGCVMKSSCFYEKVKKGVISTFVFKRML